MKLSALQRKLLQQYRGFHDSAPSMGRLMALSARHHVLLVLVFTIAVVLTYSFRLPSVALILVGMAIGAVSRDFGRFRTMIRVWPVLSRVLDWKRIDELLEDEDGSQVVA